MSGITTHVLDLSSGQPAAGIGVRLERLTGTGWDKVEERITDSDGRVKDLHLGPQVPKGVYRITFATRQYAHGKGMPTFYPEVQVMFEVGDSTQNYHVPLLFSPYGYSTYRGS
jgi:5-hydroxyisourate hydrolase